MTMTFDSAAAKGRRHRFSARWRSSTALDAADMVLVDKAALKRRKDAKKMELNAK